MNKNELRNIDIITKHKKDTITQKEIEQLEQENLELRREIDDLQIICKYLKKENIELIELLYDAKKYIKEK